MCFRIDDGGGNDVGGASVVVVVGGAIIARVHVAVNIGAVVHIDVWFLLDRHCAARVDFLPVIFLPVLFLPASPPAQGRSRATTTRLLPCSMTTPRVLRP